MSTNTRTIELTPAGRLRQGFRYQDLLAIERLVEWLRDEERFRWVKAEADDGGFLDDVQAMRSDGVMEIWQVKFSTKPNAPDDPWTWETLLQRKEGARGFKRSLLQKWHKTWVIEKQIQPVEASLVSNRRASPEFEACLSPRTTSSRIVQWEAIAPTVRATISAQLGSESEGREFLAAFKWRLDEPQLDELEQGVFARFERIGGTRGSWNRLWQSATLWIEAKNSPPPDGRILLEDVRCAARLRAHPIKLHTFLPPSAFFEHYTQEGQLFHHRSPLVGRRQELGELLNFVTDTTRRIAVLPGRGGNGKSRLIAALCRRLARRNPDLPVRIVAENVPITQPALGELQNEQCLIIMDNAHRGEGLETLLGATRQYPGIQLLLIARPHATDFLLAQLREFGFYSSQVQCFNPLRDLSLHQVRRLARVTLGREHSNLADALAEVTRDCPLLTVIGGQLLRDQHIAPSLLLQNNSFREQVLGRLRDETLTDALVRMDGRFSKEICDRVFPFIALTTPLDCTHDKLLAKLATVVKTDTPTLISLLDALVGAGMLLRGGRFIRLVPDVLSDYILQEACFLTNGSPSHWTDDAFLALREVCPENILRNLTELDWRIRSAPESEGKAPTSYGEGQALLNGVWRIAEKEFKEGTLVQRHAWLKNVERLAFMQPKPLWRLIEIARDAPKADSVEEVEPAWRRYQKPIDYSRVMGATIPLLKSIARHERFTKQCCELLWELGRDFKSERLGSQSNALAVLESLASRQLRKPIVFQAIVLDCCRRWLRDPRVHDYQNSVLGVISALLERQNRDSYSSEQYIVSGPHLSSSQEWNSFWRVRRGALDLVEHCANSQNPEVVLRAVECLKGLVSENYLHALNRSEDEKSKESRQRWEEEQLRAISIARNVALSSEDPFVRLAIQEALQQQARGPRLAIREQARKAFEAVPVTFEMKLIRAYAQSRTVMVGNRWDEGEDDNETWRRRGRDTNQLCGEVAKEFVARYRDARDGFEALGEWRQRIEASLWWRGVKEGLFTGKGNWTLSNDFLLRLTLDYPQYAQALCETALERPDAPAISSCSDILAELRRSDVIMAANLATRLLATQHPNLCHQVAQSYSWRGWPSEPTSQDWEVIHSLLEFPHPAVKRRAANVLSAIAQSFPRKAIDMALTVNPYTDSGVAEALFECFEVQRGFDCDVLTDEELTQLLLKIEPLENVDFYYIGHFLLQSMVRAPLLTTQMLLRRIDRKRGSYWKEPDSSDVILDIFNHRNCDALPSQGFHDDALKAVVHHPDYYAALQEVRDCVLLKPSLPHGDNEAELLRDLSFGWNEASLEVLNEWINSGDGEKVTHAADLLESTFIGFYAENVEFVANFLNRAYECGLEVYDNVSNSLRHHAIHGPPRSIASHTGEVSNALVDNARNALDKGGLDEITFSFFESIKAEGQKMLQREAEEREAEAVFFHR